MNTQEFDYGDIRAPSEGHTMWTAGIHVTEDGRKHGNRIEIYGETRSEAEELRNFIMEAIHTECVLVNE